MVQFHLHSANFMYISEYYEMIMLCNRGEAGVLGGGPLAAPHVRVADISQPHTYLSRCAGQELLYITTRDVPGSGLHRAEL